MGGRLPGAAARGLGTATYRQGDGLGPRAGAVRAGRMGRLALGEPTPLAAVYRIAAGCCQGSPPAGQEPFAGTDRHGARRDRDGAGRDRAGAGRDGPGAGRGGLEPGGAPVAVTPGLQRHRGGDGGGRARSGARYCSHDGESRSRVHGSAQPGRSGRSAARGLGAGPCRRGRGDRHAGRCLGAVPRGRLGRCPGRARRGPGPRGGTDLGRAVSGGRTRPPRRSAVFLGHSLPDGRTAGGGGPGACGERGCRALGLGCPRGRRLPARGPPLGALLRGPRRGTEERLPGRMRAEPERPCPAVGLRRLRGAGYL